MRFTYRAIRNNVLEKNTIEADNYKTVVSYLKDRGYFPVEIKQEKHFKENTLSKILNRITFNDIVDFTRQLAIMLNAGLTLIEALDILKKQIKKETAKAMIESIEKHIRGGGNFSSALEHYPGHFSRLYISLIKAGEASGKLAEVMKKLSDNLDKERNFKGKLKGALIYPAIVVVGMVTVIFIMITFVVPKLLELYKDFNVDLPLNTKILIWVSSFLASYWILVLIGVAVGVFLIYRYLSTKQGKLAFDSFLLRIPAVHSVMRMGALVDSTRTLSILIGSGVSILESLNIVIETTSNMVFQNAFENVYKEVERGTSVGSAFEMSSEFPPILVQMAKVGESTGHFDETLERLSVYFESESDLAIKAATTLIEPTILVVLGLAVSFIILSIMTPIYNLTTSIK